MPLYIDVSSDGLVVRLLELNDSNWYKRHSQHPEAHRGINETRYSLISNPLSSVPNMFFCCSVCSHWRSLANTRYRVSTAPGRCTAWRATLVAPY